MLLAGETKDGGDMIARLKAVLSATRVRKAFGAATLGNNVMLSRKADIALLPGADITIGDHVMISADCGIAVGGTLRIGDRSYLNPRSRINAMLSVTIGQGCAIAWDVDILDDDFHGIVVGGQVRPRQASIVIGDRVWIGARATILKGTTIGDDSVIAAGAVVSGSFPPRVLIAGVPGRVVKTIDGWEL